MTGCKKQAESGQAIIWIVVFFPMLLSLVGLVIDGGIALTERRELQDIADAAARAGAMQVDEAFYRQSEVVRLDQGKATTAAIDRASRDSARVTGVSVVGDEIGVSVSRSYRTAFVRLFGIESVTMSVTGTARARSGH